MVEACRKGKHLWLKLSKGPAVMFHFGELCCLLCSLWLLLKYGRPDTLHLQSNTCVVSSLSPKPESAGMTGSMVVKGVAAARYRTFMVDDEQWPPKYWKVQLSAACNLSFALSR